MNKYINYCSEEQIKRALKLGLLENDDVILSNQIRDCFEKQGISIIIRFDNYCKYWYIDSNKVLIKEPYCCTTYNQFESYNEAEFAAVDAALEYLEELRKKTKELDENNKQ